MVVVPLPRARTRRLLHGRSVGGGPPSRGQRPRPKRREASAGERVTRYCVCCGGASGDVKREAVRHGLQDERGVGRGRREVGVVVEKDGAVDPEPVPRQSLADAWCSGRSGQ